LKNAGGEKVARSRRPRDFLGCNEKPTGREKEEKRTSHEETIETTEKPEGYRRGFPPETKTATERKGNAEKGDKSWKGGKRKMPGRTLDRIRGGKQNRVWAKYVVTWRGRKKIQGRKGKMTWEGGEKNRRKGENGPMQLGRASPSRRGDDQNGWNGRQKKQEKWEREKRGKIVPRKNA